MISAIPWAGDAPNAAAQVEAVAPPASPLPATPDDGAFLPAGWAAIELRWDAVPGAREYQVLLNDGQRTGPWTMETAWSPGSLPAGAYSWSVRARNEYGDSAPGPAFAFTIADPAAAGAASAPDLDPLPFPLAQQAAWLNLAAASAVVATPLTVNGAGFAPGEEVSLYWDDPGSPPLLETTANELGAWTEAVPIPDDVMADHHIIARGEESRSEAAGTVSIIPSIDRPVASGLPGMEIGLTLQGFAAKETVDLRWGAEDGPSLGTARTNAAGSGQADILLPEADAGTYDLIGLGEKSGGKALSALRVEQAADNSPAGTDAAAIPAEPIAGGTMLAPGQFLVTATVEGLVGGTTSSGHQIAADDHYVSLPACTNTSCPWLEPGVAHELFGLRTECGENCYVKVENPETGACAVAPVLETGPWFTLDNWWDPTETRALNQQSSAVNFLAQGYAGADAANDGLDVGFGRTPDGVGISNKGYVVGNRAALDLANGTWQDIGFDLDTGIGSVVATMLWQTGESPQQAAAACQPAREERGRDRARDDDAPADALDTPADEAGTDAAPPEVAATPVAEGTPAPVVEAPAEEAAADDAAADAATSDDVIVEPAPETAEGGEGQADESADDGATNPDKDEREKRERDNSKKDKKKDKDERERGGRDPNNGNGGVSEVVAEPLYFQQPVELEQQDASDASAGATGDSGTINGVPRETPESAPPAVTGPGVPLPPGEVLLPPSVPGVPAAGAGDPGAAAAPGGDPAATGITGTTELVFTTVSDTTVFLSSPGAPQSPESAGLLAIGGPSGAVALLSFEVTGVTGPVLAARLTFSGAGESGAPGGSVGIIYDFIVPEGLTANGAPSSQSALNIHGAPAWFERVEPGGLTAVDVTGSISGDGQVTFVLPGQSEEMGQIYASESGVPAQLILTVGVAS